MRPSIIAFIITTCSLLAFAQQPKVENHPAEKTDAVAQAFDAKRYSDYLTSISQETISPQKPNDLIGAYRFDKLTRIAIALEKTKGWGGEADKKIRKMLANYAGKDVSAPRNGDQNGGNAGKDAGDPSVGGPIKQLDALHILLEGDVTGAITIYHDRHNEPAFDSATKAIGDFREHGFPLAANALETLKRDLTGKRITAWLSIPADKRQPIDDFMLKNYLPSSMNRRALVQIAWKLYEQPPKEANVIAERYFDFAYWFGKDTGTITFDTAIMLNQDKRHDGAIALVKKLANEHPDDPGEQRFAVNLLLNSLGASQKEVLDFYQQIFATGKEPYLHDIRRDYFDAIKLNRLTPEKETLNSIAQDADNLRAGDALLTSGEYDKATDKFRATLEDTKADVAHRASAWAGLLASDPGEALQAMTIKPDNAPGNYEPLLDSVVKMPVSDERARLIRWLGWQLHDSAILEVPPAPGEVRTVFHPSFRPLRKVKDWEPQMAKIMERLLAIDSLDCLKPVKLNIPSLHSEDTPSLRYTAVLLYGLSGENDKAAEIAERKIKYMVQPPPGGWADFPGVPSKDFDQPREESSPTTVAETERMIAELTGAVTRYETAHNPDPTVEIPSPPLNVFILQEEAKNIAACTDPQQMMPLIRTFSNQFELAVTHLDPLPLKGLILNQPPPPTRAVKMEYFDQLRDIARGVFQNGLACHSAAPFIGMGIQPSMLTASNPELLKALNDLAMEVLDKYQQAEGAEKTYGVANSLVGFLEVRRVYDMKAYAKALRDKYPKPEPKPKVEPPETN